MVQSVGVHCVSTKTLPGGLSIDGTGILVSRACTLGLTLCRRELGIVIVPSVAGENSVGVEASDIVVSRSSGNLVLPVLSGGAIERVWSIGAGESRAQRRRSAVAVCWFWTRTPERVATVQLRGGDKVGSRVLRLVHSTVGCARRCSVGVDRRLEDGAVFKSHFRSIVHATGGVESLAQNTVVPAFNKVGMETVPCCVTVGPDEMAVEVLSQSHLVGQPGHFVKESWDSDGVREWTVAEICALDDIGHVRVVRLVQVFAVPALWETERSLDTTVTVGRTVEPVAVAPLDVGQRYGSWVIVVGYSHALEDLDGGSRLVVWTTGNHSKSLWEWVDWCSNSVWHVIVESERDWDLGEWVRSGIVVPVQGWEPIVGLVGLNSKRRAFGIGVRGRVVTRTETGSTCNLVIVSRHAIGVDNRIELLIDQDDYIVVMPRSRVCHQGKSRDPAEKGSCLHFCGRIRCRKQRE